MIKSASVIPLRKCPVCGGDEVVSFYMADRTYRYRCFVCGQYFEFNARNQAQADHMWNELFKR